jgi:short-subunit dehydrogenase
LNTNKVVLITGASSGIGYAAALAFARRGWQVAALARRLDRLAELRAAVESLPTPHGELLPLEADVRDPLALERAALGASVHFGHLNALIANAGVGQRGALVEAQWSDLETVLRTNIDGVLHSIRAAVPLMRSAGGGQIAIISSVTAGLTVPYTAAYGASKAFVSSIARSLRLELEPDGIGVTEMLVGRTESEFNQKRLGQAGRGQGAGSVPVMRAETVADAIVRAVERRQRRVILRSFDRLLRLALRQYRG